MQLSCSVSSTTSRSRRQKSGRSSPSSSPSKLARTKGGEGMTTPYRLLDREMFKTVAPEDADRLCAAYEAGDPNTDAEVAEMLLELLIEHDLVPANYGET